MIEMKNLWKFILALFGLGGVAVMSTGAWSVPQSGVYSQLLPAPQWLYAGDTASCIWEVHPNTTKTINSVSYGSPGSWTSCTQNQSDLLLWTCDSVTVVEGNVSCTQIRVVQNENPGTSETLFNGTMDFKTASVKGSKIPGCSGADCILSSPLILNNGTYIARNFQISSLLTIGGNVTFMVLENFTVAPSGSIVISPSKNPNMLNITSLVFINQGTINGNGYAGSPGTLQAVLSGCGCSSGATNGGPGATLRISSSIVNNTGTIILNGGKGGNGAASCNGLSPWYGSACNAAVGGTGGVFELSNTRAMFHNTGSISLTGGDGGDAGYSGSGCGGFCTACGNIGGVGGNLTISSVNFTSSNTISVKGGNGANGLSVSFHNPCTCGVFGGSPPGYGGGAGGLVQIGVSQNVSVTQEITSVGGLAGLSVGYCGAVALPGINGSNNVSYCSNGTGMDWSKIVPTANTSTMSCMAKPSVSFSVPNSSSNFTAYLQNISVNVSSGANLSYMISFSKDNRSTWQWLSPDYYTIPFNGSNNNTAYLDTHRQGSDIQNNTWMRALAYNSSSGIYSDYAYAQFSLTNMPTNVSQFSIPNGTVTTSVVTFYCNYTNSSGGMIEAATPEVVVDGTQYDMAWNSTNGLYYWTNNQTWVAGNHTWYCSMDKANYRHSNGSVSTIMLSGFGITIAGGKTNVTMFCPFPTISGMTPPGQKAGIGIFRITNYNTTALKNYTVFLNNTPPSGIYVYARCDRYSPNLPGWTQLSTDTGYGCLKDINSSNSSAYVWLRMDCVGATPGATTPFSYIFNEE